MKITNMEHLLVGELEDLYDAEQRLVKALPKMAEASSSPELRAAFEGHLEETKGHVGRLEQVFTHIGEKVKAKTCEAMKGLIEEGNNVVSSIEKSPLRDAGLIAAANRVEHYEIAAYGSARAFARMLGFQTSADTLERTLEEEKAADQKLTQIAENMVNQRAASSHA